jgi:large subunit ribosomal protein L17
MRHKNKVKIFSRPKAQREALMRNLAESLILHESIETTVAKAKALRTFVEPLVTLAKNKEALTARRELQKTLYTNEVMKKLIETIAPRYTERPGGYTRVVKIGSRKNDGADMAIIEFVR